MHGGQGPFGASLQRALRATPTLAPFMTADLVVVVVAVVVVLLLTMPRPRVAQGGLLLAAPQRLAPHTRSRPH
jgi:hypothetical protein